MGLASGPYFLAANPLVSELFPERVGGAIGVHGTASQVAAVVAAPLVGGVLLLADWRTAFWLIAGAAAVSTAAIYLSARGAELPTAGADDRDLLGAVRAQWRIVLTGVAVVGITGFVWNGLFNFYVTYLVSEGVAETTGRTLLTVAFAAGVPAFLITGRVADRVPYVPLLLSILAAFVGSVLLLTVTSGFWPLVAVSALVGYVIHSLFPAIDTFLLDSLPDHHRGSAYAVFSATMMLIQAAGSVVVGGLHDAGLSYDAVFRGLAGLLAVVLAVLTVLYWAGRLPSGARLDPEHTESAVAD
jgi:MFS family permease